MPNDNPGRPAPPHEPPPPIERLSDGVWCLPVKTFTLPPATHTNCYVLGEKDLVVVDPASPLPAEQERLLACLNELSTTIGGKVVEIWLTHQHSDHIGGVNHLRQALQVPVAAHRATAEALHEQVTVDQLLQDGEDLAHGGAQGHSWQALHTPGHAAGHLCFYDPGRHLLITGDNVLGVGSVLIAPPEGDMALYLESLGRMRDLNPKMLLPAHGPTVNERQARAHIQALIDHRLAREEAIVKLLEAAGALKPDAIVKGVYADTPKRLHGLAELNVRTHVAKLVGEGRARQAADGAVSLS